MTGLARRVRNRERVSPGDALGLSWRLRRRMVPAGHPRLPTCQGRGPKKGEDRK